MGAIDHLIDGVAVPPPVHVGLAETQGAARQHALEQPLVMDAYVPWAIAVDSNVGGLDQALEVPSQS